MFIEMDRIVMTELARSLFDCSKPEDRLPTLQKPIKSNNNENSLQTSKKSHASLSVLSLRKLLKNESVNELTKLREQSQKRNYMKVKKELLRDISNGKQFLNVKAEQIAKKIMADKQKCETLNVGIEIGKGKNYLNKIIKDFECMQMEKLKINGLIQDKMKGEQDSL